MKQETLERLIQEQEELQKIFPPIYRKFMYGREQYKKDSLNGLTLWRDTGCVDRVWGRVTKTQILKAQRLWAIEQQLETLTVRETQAK